MSNDPARVIPLSPLPACSSSSSSTPAPNVGSSSSKPIETPQPMPFFGGTIIFVPSPPSPPPTPSTTQPHRRKTSIILPDSLPSPLPTPLPTSHADLTPPPPLEIKCHARARIPTPHGHVFLHLYKSNRDRKEHLAIVFDPAQLVPSPASASSSGWVRRKGDIRSQSLDARWQEGESEMERLIRGAYVGRLTEQSVNVPSTPLEEDSDGSGEGEQPALVRIHSECFTGETIGSQRCDCGEQLDESLRLISLPTRSDPNDPTSPLIPGRGVIVYLRQEGRGIGLLSKLLAYNLQDLGHDTVSANLALGHLADERTYDLAAGILADLGLGQPGGEGIRLMTNNPDKVAGLRKEGVEVVERVSMVPRSWQTYPHAKMDGFPLTEPPSLAGTPPPTLLSAALGDALHPEVRAREKEQWLKRKGGVGMIGGSETRSPELDRYLKTKVERMGHLLELPKAPSE